MLEGDLVLYTRRGCHLCAEGEAILLRVAQRAGRTFRRCEIGGDPAAAARFGERVPVLVCGGREVCWGRFDAAALAGLLGAAPDPPGEGSGAAPARAAAGPRRRFWPWAR